MPNFQVKFERAVTVHETCSRIIEAETKERAEEMAKGFAADFDREAPEDADEVHVTAEDDGVWAFNVGEPTDKPADYRDEDADPAPADPFFDALLERGYETEVVGGGDQMLSRYWGNGYSIMISRADGSSLPAERDWCICLYRPGSAGHCEARDDIRSPDVRGSVFDALDMLEKRIPA